MDETSSISVSANLGMTCPKKFDIRITWIREVEPTVSPFPRSFHQLTNESGNDLPEEIRYPHYLIP